MCCSLVVMLSRDAFGHQLLVYHRRPFADQGRVSCGPQQASGHATDLAQTAVPAAGTAAASAATPALHVVAGRGT